MMLHNNEQKTIIFCVGCGYGYHEDFIVWHEDKPFCQKCADMANIRCDIKGV
jgi:hypothetical protein